MILYLIILYNVNIARLRITSLNFKHTINKLRSTMEKLFKVVFLAKIYTDINIPALTCNLNWFLCSFLETILFLPLHSKLSFPQNTELNYVLALLLKKAKIASKLLYNHSLVALKMAAHWGKLIAISQMQECVGDTVLIFTS